MFSVERIRKLLPKEKVNHKRENRCLPAGGGAARWTALVCCAQAVFMAAAAELAVGETNFVRVSPRDPRYFELTDGRAYVPIGLNMIAPPGERGWPVMQEWTRRLAAQGGNFIRVWLGNPYFDIEHERSGEYDAQKAGRIDTLLALAAEHGIRVKLCLESFRHFGTRSQTWSSKPLHLETRGGPARDIADFFDGARSREQFKRKLAWYANRYGDHSTVFGWELWNEINAVAGGDYLAWTEVMLAELHRLFPRNLCMQSLGSFDTDNARPAYRRLSLMPGNDVAQVHRYLDLGARLAVCQGPVDVLAADAVRELRAFNPGRPILLAEGGAVEPSHTGPFKLYAKDAAGIILHDVLFTPFFAGAAGPGHIWHWEQYVARMDLWHHFGRFAEAVKDLDPPAEHFEPSMLPHARLRIYVLKGRHTWLLWCRDSQHTWQTELAQGQTPEPLQNAVVDLGQAGELNFSPQARVYDPWDGQWQSVALERGRVVLPEFTRSVVVKLISSGPPPRQN